MKKLILSCLVLVSAGAFAQVNILNAKSADQFRQMRDQQKMIEDGKEISTEIKPLSYGYTNPDDVIKSMVTWEIIDLNQPLNQPFYYNVDGLVQSNKSLYQILIDGINSGQIKDVYDDDEFTTKLTPDQVKERLTRTVMSDELLDKIASGAKVTDEEKKEGTDVFKVNSEKVRLIKIKGMWYIDKRDGAMKYRLLGLSVMGQDPQTLGLVGPDGLPIKNDELIDLFWVYYPDVRPVLANSIIFNAKNRSSQISFDDVLNARRFSSIIYKSDNGMGNGVIKDYMPGDAEAQLEESDRIKGQILQMENEMWSY